MNLLVGSLATRLERAERQPPTQVLRALGRGGTELSQADRMVMDAGDDFSVRARFERDVTDEPGG
jgi:hypothetical protein